MDLTAVYCEPIKGGCGHVVMDYVANKDLTGLFIRPICPGKHCRRRVWLEGEGMAWRVVRTDRKPQRLPRAAA